MSAVCRTCGRPIVWAAAEGGSRMPLDPEALEPAAGLVAYVESLGVCRVLRHEDLLRPLGDGVTAHRSHFVSCPQAAEHRGVPRGQTRLDI